MKATTAIPSIVLLIWSASASGQGDPMRGLWVGEARLNFATEVTVPLDEDNIPRAPDPDRPTPTFDIANLRLILHVNGAGQVSLLKDVAILKRTDEILVRESDFSLVTDPRLFPDFPDQVAQRIASVVFDFGDQKATDAVQAVMDAAVEAAAAVIHGSPTSTQEQARQAAETAAQAVVAGADAEAAFATFLADALAPADVDAIADSPDPRTSTEAVDARDAATELRDGPPGGPASFYRDARGSAMVEAVVTAVEGAADGQERVAAQNAAASFADLDNQYGRFLAGKVLGDMIAPAADAAAALGVLRLVQGFAGTPGAEPVEVSSPGHGLNAGDVIGISESGAGDYDGSHVVTVLDADRFSIPVVFVAPRPIGSYGGTVGEEPLTVNSPGHGLADGQRIIISGAGVAAYNGEHIVTVVDPNSFTVDAVVQGPGGSNGEWAAGGAWKHGPAAIMAAVRAVPEEDAAGAEALRFQSPNRYRDTRGTAAVTAVVDAIVQEAVEAKELLVTSLAALLQEKAGTALADADPRFPVPRYDIPEMVPTGDYNDFVRAADTQRQETFLTSPEVAADAAAKGAFEKRRDDPLLVVLSSADRLQVLEDAAEVAAANALEDTFAAAARTIRPELPLEGTFAPGAENPVFRWDLPGGESLGPAGLEGTLVLPAMHPTNPFRHRRHRDHTVGFDIVRKIRLDFDADPPDPLDRAGFGVDRITGIYREEITKPDNKIQGGLHKPLGTGRDRGLTVEGRFELNRISLIDALNAR